MSKYFANDVLDLIVIRYINNINVIETYLKINLLFYNIDHVCCAVT